MKSAPWSLLHIFVWPAVQPGEHLTECSASHCTARHATILGDEDDKRGKMAEATARAASIKRYGEALGDPALA